MALKVLLESLDGIEDAIKSLYTEKDGKFVLDLDGVDSHPNVLALKNGHANSKRERDQAKGDLEKLKQKYANVPDDFDADEWNRLKTEEAARIADPANKDVAGQIKTAVDAARSQEQAKAKATETRLNGEIEKLKGENAKKDGQLRKRLVDDELTKALTEAGVTDPRYLKASAAMLKGDIEVAEEDGEPVVRMKSDLGGGDVKSYVSNWTQTDDGKAFVAPAKGGDERTTGKGGSTGPNPYTKAQWNMTEQGRLETSDRAKAERLAKAAGFKDLAAAQKATGPIA